MDKKNQHNNLGGLHSKPPPNALPPIWEDIAGALDATDNLTQQEQDAPETDVEHEQQVADFSVIKAGFVTTFGQQEPPKFLWDTIEQDLEAHVETDAPTEFSRIKDSFLATFGQQQPPQSLWKQLAERVDQPEVEEPVQEKANYSRIKNSFERKYSAIVVPLFSWDDLVERMDTEAILSDTPDRFSCIKESFEAVYADKEPAAAVATGLWERLYPLAPLLLATQQVVQSPWTKRAAVVVLLLLGLGTWYQTPTQEATLAVTNSTTDRNQLSFLNREAATSTNNNSLPTVPQLENIATEQLANYLTVPKEPTKESNNKNNAVTLSENTTAPIAPSNTTEELYSDITKENNKVTTIAQNRLTPASRALTIPLTEKDNGTVITTNNTAQVPANIAIVTRKYKENNLPFKELNALQGIASNKGTLEAPILPAVTISLVEEGWTALSRNYIPDPAIARMEKKAFREVRPAIRGKKMHFEFGVEGRLGTSILLEQQGTEQGAKEIMLCPTGAVGLNFQYYFGMHDALVLGAYPYSSTIQCQGEQASASGAYKETAMKLSFMDFTVGYQRVLLRYGSLAEEPSSIYARLNLGMGWLTSSDTRINKRPIYTPDLYKNLNWSAGLSLGNLHRMQRFVLDYGLMGNIGLNRFITGAQPNVLQPARIVNIGAYVGLRYLFMPRKAPSKKQRQFDWSAPFYIEEPRF